MEQDRPIQAGEWVECVDDSDSGRQLTVGKRERVAGLSKYIVGPCLRLESAPSVPWLASRFKRVDGPHPKARNFGESEETCASCSEGGCFGEQTCEMAGDGKWYCEACIDGAREQHGADEPVATVAAPVFCAECPTALTPETTGMAPFCKACTDRRWPMAKADPYATYRANKSEVMVEKATWDYPQNQWVRHTREADEAALRREAERPRLTADARELAKPHPWEEFE